MTDELNHRTQYGRDDYQRLIQTIDPLGNISTFSYLPWGKTSSYLTTSDFVYSSTLPSSRIIYNYADNEHRLLQSTEAPGTSDQAISYFTYDAVGNRLTEKNPRGNTTTHAYDKRNREISATRPLSQITRWDYDQASNKTKETRPDNKYRT